MKNDMPDRRENLRGGEHGHIEFWFDFSSPYGYFASLRIDEVARRHGRQVAWRPFLLGVVFGKTGTLLPISQPLKGDYLRRDWERMARAENVPYRFPGKFPIAAIAPSRMFYSVEACDADAAIRFARRSLTAYYEQGLDISEPETAASCGDGIGLDARELLAAHQTPASKELLKARTEEALAKGVFGSPFFIVDGEPFWGADRLDMLDRWLTRGGW